MPPPMNAEGNETPDLTTDDLSDNAIEILYEIVRRAQSAVPSSHPSRDLFNAYEEVLSEHGIGPQDDGVLHRFLFHMQADQRSGEGLLERFKRVLREMRIIIEIGEEGEGIEVTTGLGDTPRGGRNLYGQGLERRGSVDSFLDGSADKIAGSTDVGQDLHPQPRQGKVDRWKKRRSQSDTEAQVFSQAQLPIRGRPNGYGDRRTASEQYRSTHRRSGSVSSRGSIQIRRNGQPTTSRFGGYDADDSEQSGSIPDDRFDFSHVQIPGVNSPIPDANHRGQQFVPEPFRPSDTRLMDDAEMFEQQRIHSLARSTMQIWRNRTRDQSIRNVELEGIAIAHDRDMLLKPAIGILLEEANRRRSNRETERFFGRLERRAEKARGLFLLTKAFTHWAKSAEDEVLRTSVARRHILRTKFFNGWREITAVNELKVQHFILGRFLDKWRRRTSDVLDRQDVVLQLYDDNLVRKYFKDWFFKFCNIAAPAWHGVRLKRTTFEKWHEIAVLLKGRERWAADRRDHEVSRRALQGWMEKTTMVQALEPRAEEIRQRALLTSALTTLQKQAQLAPLLAQFRTKVDMRVVRSALGTWRQNTKLERQARNVDQSRILRNAWTAWNDRLRVKALEERINDRVLVETMYKWALASRVSLFQRVHDRNLKESVFLTWITKTNERRNTLDGAERRFALFKRTQLLRSCLRRIESATTERRAEEFAVTAEYDSKLKQRLFEKLVQENERSQELNKWAGDAHFYLLATKSLKKWNEATQHARRNRRRETYAHVRRMVKMNAVRRAFDVWRDKANGILDKQRQAEEMAHGRKVQNSTTILTHWHDRTSFLLAREAHTVQQHKNRLGSSYFYVCTQRISNLQTMDTQAIALRQESTDIAAASALKKLGWRLWNAQRQEENALALHQRNFEKHLRAMIRFWFEQTAERAATRAASPTPRSRSRGERHDRDDGDGDGNVSGVGDGLTAFDDAGDDTRRLEAWTAFDESGLGLPDLDLSLSLSPQASNVPTAPLQPPSSILRTRPSNRPQTYPQPQSAFRAPQPPPSILEDPEFNDPSAFWTSTPMPPQPRTVNKPGYLKTPSKRSVARSKRPELPASPEKRVIGLDRGVGSMSAPPAGMRDVSGEKGVTSFGARLREGGFGDAGGRGRGRGRGKGRVGFGDVSRIE